MKMRPYAALALLLVVLGLFLGGCRTLKLGGLATEHDKADDRPGLDKAADVKQPDPPKSGPGAPAVASAAARPSKYSLRIAPYVFHSDFELKRDLPLFKELAGLRDQVYKELQLPMASTPIEVFLFEDGDRYQRYMAHHYPALPKRRAFFVAQPRGMGSEDLMVFTSWGDRIQQDLRHELTHALLHSVLKDVPLWLDEGLAEYFELPPEKHGVNAAHLAQMMRGPTAFKPNLAKLEGVVEVKDMNPAEYREAWAWVHLMLRGSTEGRNALLAYLQQLRANPAPGPLRPRLAAVIQQPDEALVRHLDQIERASLPMPMASIGK